MFLKGDPTAGKLVAGLSASALRQRVIAHNLANFNTPGFKRSTVSFEEQLRRAGGPNMKLQCTHPAHLLQKGSEEGPQLKTDSTTTRRLDGNNVDLEREMVDLVTNQLRYNAYVQQVNSRFNQWRYVINEGRR